MLIQDKETSSSEVSKVSATIIKTEFDTPLGSMIACAVDEGICLLEFNDRPRLLTEYNELTTLLKAELVEGDHPLFIKLKTQLLEYFSGQRKEFDLPLCAPGTLFQKKVWEVLKTIPFGSTRSYKAQAIALGNLAAIRAVASANGHNRIAIVIPCHRVIGENGSLIGYGGGLWRKKWLLEHEGKFSTQFSLEF